MHYFMAHGGDGEAAIHEALAGPDPAMTRTLAEAVILLREHPSWAVWMPTGRRDWTAARPASSRSPGPDLPMIWVHAETSAELANRMHSADAQLPAIRPDH